jgi:hypothetical protein
MKMKKGLVFALALGFSVCGTSLAVPLSDNPCGVQDPDTLAHEPVCTDLSCVPSRIAQAKQVDQESKCEFERLQPPALGLAPPPEIRSGRM